MLTKGRLIILLLIAVTISLTPLVSESVEGQNKTSAAAGQKKGASARDKAQKSRGGGQDENIKNNSDQNDPKDAEPKPGEGKSRGELGRLFVENQTNLRIKIYFNGDYVGLVSPYGTSTAPVTPGKAVLYARADFTDDSFLNWGPRTEIFYAGRVFTWTLSY